MKFKTSSNHSVPSTTMTDNAAAGPRRLSLRRETIGAYVPIKSGLRTGGESAGTSSNFHDL